MQQHRGFTIIEVVLFLAISSGLAIFLLVGTSAAIQRQQYRDSVQSFAGFLRGQHDRVVSVQNERAADQSCPISGSDGGTSARGQSNCIVIGRYIATLGPTGGTDGKRYAAWPVYALKSGDTWRYARGASDTEYRLHWGARTKLSSQGNDNAHIAILMYRDPENGSVVIRANSGRYSDATIGDFFVGETDSGATGESQFGRREICVYNEGLLAGERLSVLLGRRAGSADAVTITSEIASGCKNA